MTIWAWDATTASLDASSAAKVTAFNSYALGSAYMLSSVAYADGGSATAYTVPITAETTTPLGPVPIPHGTRPSTTSDRTLVVRDNLGTGTRYDMAAVVYNTSTSLVTSASYGAFALSGAAYETGPGSNSGTAACVSPWDGVIFPSEITAGTISHTLQFCCPNVGPAPNPYPARPGSSGYPANTGVPLGTWMRVDPTVNVAALGMSAGETTIAVALQQHGMVCRDINPSNFAIYLTDEVNQTALGNATNWNLASKGITLPIKTGGYPYAQAFSATFLTLLKNHLQVLQPPPSSSTPPAATAGVYGSAVLDTFPGTSGPLSASWTKSTVISTGDFRLVSNQAGPSYTDSVVYWNTNLGGAGTGGEAFFQVNATGATGQNFGPVFELDPATGNGYSGYANPTAASWSSYPFRLLRITSFATSQTGSDITGITHTDGDFYELARQPGSNNIELWQYTAGVWTSRGSWADGTWKNNTTKYAGMYGDAAAQRFDYFGAGQLNAAPVNTVAPSLTGSTTLGSTLTTDNGTWTSSPAATYTYQWERNSVNIASATTSSYTITAADLGATLACDVTAHNTFGSAAALSNSLLVPGSSPVNTVSPVVSGSALVGQSLTTTDGTWTGIPDPTFTYQWQRGGVDIPGANSVSYLLVTADSGTTVNCQVTASNSLGSSSADSNGLAVTTSGGGSPAGGAGVATIADIPGRYDVVVNGFGYQLLDTIEPSLPFRSQRAMYSHSPTFVERSNVSGGYGDNQQAFWLTASQNDWSLGEQQRYFRQQDPTSKRRYWHGANANVSWVPGQASIDYAYNQISLGFSVVTCVPARSANTAWIGAYQCATSDEAHGGATRVHGASVTNSQAVCQDGNLCYIGDNTHIRTWDYNTTFATFTSATGTQCLAYVNNTLFSGYQNQLSYFDTAGNVNLVYKWLSANGTSSSSFSPQPVMLTAYGGQVMAVVTTQVAGGSAELWLADTTGAQRVGALPSNFVPQDVCLANEIVFFSGVLKTVVGVNANFSSPAVFYYANGNIGKLWQSHGNDVSPNVSIAPCRGGVVFNDPTNDGDGSIAGGSLVFYDIANGGVSSIGVYADNGGTVLAGGDKNLAVANQTSQGNSFFSVYASPAAFAIIETSLFDFDSSLTKVFRGVTVDWADAADPGGTVDVAYQLDTFGIGGNPWTPLAFNVTSGQEYTLPGDTTGRSIAVKVTLNTNTSTWGPLLKRIYVRAAPQLQSYKNREYVLDLSGVGFKDPVELNDGSPDPLSGHEKAVNLIQAITTTTPFTISDRFGSFTGLCEPDKCEIYETREGNDAPKGSGTFVARIVVREI